MVALTEIILELDESYYCSVLVLTKYLGIFPYDGDENQYTLNNFTEANLNEFYKITNETPPKKLIEDLRFLNGEDLSKEPSNETRLVILIENILEAVSLTTPEELEEFADAIVEGPGGLKIRLLSSITKDENGLIVPGDYFNNYLSFVKERRT